VVTAPEPAVGTRDELRGDASPEAVSPSHDLTVVEVHAPATTPAPALRTRNGQRLWMEGLGRHTRRTREFLSLTQEQLATAAGTSQAAISRLEHGGALGTPYLVVVAVQRALTEALRHLSRGGWQQATAAPDPVHPSVLPEAESATAKPGLDTDEEWLRYVAAYRGAAPAQRSHLVVVVEAVASTVPGDCS
jgi:transcriptional regulator with XRE-family HTH domain